MKQLIKNKILNFNGKLSQRLKVSLCLFLACLGLLLFGKWVTTAYLQSQTRCKPVVCQTGQCGNFDRFPMCDEQSDCPAPKKCAMHYGRCSNSTPQDPIRCAGAYCTGDCLSGF